jgi:predicted nucleotidyltransferase
MDPAALLFAPAPRRAALSAEGIRAPARARARRRWHAARAERAAAAGVLLRKPVGNQVRFRPLTARSTRTAQHPEEDQAGDVLREALAPLGGNVRAAFVYGSVARGDERARSDLDFMVVGDASFGDVVAALAPAQESLRREVNPNVYPALEFRKKLAAGDPFLKRPGGAQDLHRGGRR